MLKRHAVEILHKASHPKTGAARLAGSRLDPSIGSLRKLLWVVPMTVERE
jgi:hypothetical protein